jgi:hypothetical protein
VNPVAATSCSSCLYFDTTIRLAARSFPGTSTDT